MGWEKSLTNTIPSLPKMLFVCTNAKYYYILRCTSVRMPILCTITLYQCELRVGTYKLRPWSGEVVVLTGERHSVIFSIGITGCEGCKYL